MTDKVCKSLLEGYFWIAKLIWSRLRLLGLSGFGIGITIRIMRHYSADVKIEDLPGLSKGLKCSRESGGRREINDSQSGRGRTDKNKREMRNGCFDNILDIIGSENTRCTFVSKMTNTRIKITTNFHFP